jgi:polyisoprenoid-binding protein YceI
VRRESTTSRSADVVAYTLAAVALLHGAPLAAQQNTIDFTVSGNSTVRGWTCTVKGNAQITPGSGAAARGFDGGVQSATLTVPVQDFVCPEAEMRDHLLEAMRATEFPQITFRLDGYEPNGQGALANGSLTILDRTQPVSIPLALAPSGGGVQVTGTLPLDMTTYGVEPPVVMLGLLRVRPQIRIEFTGVVTP